MSSDISAEDEDEEEEEDPFGGLVDAIVTDPPYDMAETVRSFRSDRVEKDSENDYRGGVGGRGGKEREVDDGSMPARLSNGNIPPIAKIDEILVTMEGEEKRVRAAATASSLAVGGAISTLFMIASERLRVGGRLVFFAPFRDLSQRGDKEEFQGETRANTADDIRSEGGVDNGGGGRFQSDSDGAEFQDIIAPSYDNMDEKMKKRKSFKKWEKKNSETNDVTAASLSNVPVIASSGARNEGPRTDDFSPLNFLPPLPGGLVLLEYYQQVMSPSFSRWLCVVEKREEEEAIP